MTASLLRPFYIRLLWLVMLIPVLLHPAVAANESNIKQISAGSAHSCAVTKQGALYCWGANKSGQIGNGSTGEDVLAPYEVFSKDVTAVATGRDYTCAVVHAALYCWGDNAAGQIGNGSKGGVVPGPVKIIDAGVTAVVSGQGGNLTNCALVNGALRCWGLNVGNFTFPLKVNALPTEAAVDVESTAYWTSPVEIFSEGVTDVSIGDGVCAVVDTALLCMGALDFSHPPKFSKQPPKIWIHSGVTAVSASQLSTCAIVHGGLVCMGDISSNRQKPVQVYAKDVTGVFAGDNHTCAIVNGGLSCWDTDRRGKLIEASNTPPTARPLLPEGVSAYVDNGVSTRCVLVHGALRCRGQGSGVLQMPMFSGYLFGTVPLTDTIGDIDTISADTTAQLAQTQREMTEKLFQAIAKRLQGKLVYAFDNAYYVDDVGLNIDLSNAALNLVAIPLFPLTHSNEQRDASNTIRSFDASILPDAKCGDMLRDVYQNDSKKFVPVSLPYFGGQKVLAIDTAHNGLVQNWSDYSGLYIQNDDHFIAIEEYFADLGPLLPLLIRSGNVRSIALGVEDIKKLRVCADAKVEKMKGQPFAALRLVATKGLDGVELQKKWEESVKAGLTPVWQITEPHVVNSLKLDIRSDVHSDDFTVEAQTITMMQCHSNFLASWKRAEAPAWKMNRKDNEFALNTMSRGEMDHEYPTAFNYTQDELLAAINQSQGMQGLANPDEIKSCALAVWGDKFSVRYQSKLVQEIDVSHPGISQYDEKNQPDANSALHWANRLNLFQQSPTYADATAWPGKPDQTIAAYASLHKNDDGTMPDENADQVDFDLDLFIIKTSTGEILQRYSQPRAFPSDAMHFDGMSLDTANYQLMRGVRAFGVRASYSHHGCAGAENETLSLFEPEGKALRPILSGLDTLNAEAMCQTCGYSRSTRTIALADASSHGYRDLIVQEKTEAVDEGVQAKAQDNANDNACIEKVKRSRRKTVLHFDGVNYSSPEKEAWKPEK